jgi:hypothetical protein
MVSGPRLPSSARHVLALTAWAVRRFDGEKQTQRAQGRKMLGLRRAKPVAGAIGAAITKLVSSPPPDSFLAVRR